MNLEDLTPEAMIAQGGFLCGSRAYGTPRDDSDTDVVVHVTEREMESLYGLSDEAADDFDGEDSDDSYDGTSSLSLRFGSMNLICFTERDIFDAWKSATESLIARRPVTREQAVDVISAAVAMVHDKAIADEAEYLTSLCSYEEF